MNIAKVIRPVAGIVAAVLVVGAMILTTTWVAPGTTPSAGGDAQGLDPKTWAQQNYDAKVVPAVKDKAQPWADLAKAIVADPNAAGAQFGQKEEGANNFSYATTVTGTLAEGTLGVMTIKAEGTPDGVNLGVAVGPAITTSALRDVTGLVTFGMFQNQGAYQQASTELNNMVKAEVLAKFDAAGAAGKSYTITGAFTWDGTKNVVLTPISIEAAA